MVTSTSQVRLTERDLEILEHMRTFRMTTMPVLHRLFFADQDIDAVRSWKRRMRGAGLIDTAPFVRYEKYLHLTLAGWKKLGEQPPKGRTTLTEFPLARQYGMLAFCCLLDTVQRKLTAREFVEKFPSLADNSMPKDYYYVDKDSQPQRLGFIYVDHGRKAERVYQRYRDIIRQRFKHPPWRQDVIERGRFIVAIVTAKPAKKKLIEQVFAKQKLWIPYRVEAVPDLIDLI